VQVLNPIIGMLILSNLVHGYFLNENPILGIFRQNAPSRLIHDVTNAPNIGGSL
jgi:hypothetical protein